MSKTSKARQTIIICCGFLALFEHLYLLFIAAQAHFYLATHRTDMPVEILLEIACVGTVGLSVGAALVMWRCVRSLEDPSRARMWTLLAMAAAPLSAFLAALFSGFSLLLMSLLPVVAIPLGAVSPYIAFTVLSRVSRGKNLDSPLSRREWVAVTAPIFLLPLPLLWVFGKPALEWQLNPPRLTLPHENLNFAAFSPDSKLLATSSGISDQPGELRVWDAQTGKVLWSKPFNFAVYEVVFTPDGKALASQCYDDTVRVWNPRNGQLLRSFKAPGGHCFLSADGKTMVVTNGMKVGVYNFQTGKLKWALALKGDGDTVAQSPDGKLLASIVEEKTVRLWDARTGAVRQTLLDRSERLLGVQAVAFSPDGVWLASADGVGSRPGARSDTYGQVRLWKTTTWQEQAPLKHGDWVHRVAFSPDGKLLVTESGGEVQLWDVASWTQSKTLPASDFMAVSPDGLTLASTNRDSVYLWNTKP